LRHVAYTGAWKKCEPLWDAIIRARMLRVVVPLMERVMGGGRREALRGEEAVTVRQKAIVPATGNLRPR